MPWQTERWSVESPQRKMIILLPSIRKKDSDQSKYIVLIDPLDGSSNIDVNVSVGTIFPFFIGLLPKVTRFNQRIFYKEV